jgi:phosphoribosylformylglycinamidine cyclo-ligase
MSDADAYGTFNMGLGFALFVGAHDSGRAVEVGRAAGIALTRIGVVEPGPRRVVLAPLGVTFDDASLHIR